MLRLCRKAESMRTEYKAFEGLALVFLLLTGILCYNYFTVETAEVYSQSTAASAAPQVALTFDDGPDPVWTPKLLDGLKERGVPATFFLIGRKIEGQEELVQRIHDEGHLIGNHTFNHVELSKLPDKDARMEIEKTSNVIYEVTGEYPQYVRPPFGEWNEKLELEVTMLPVLWNVDPLDWRRTDVEGIVRDVEKKAEDGSIILMHDCYETSVEAALRIADDLTRQGYRFVTADQLILE